MNGAWHYTTYLDAVDHWQTLITGVFALLSAAVAVLVTVRIENWKSWKDEKDALLNEIRIVNKGIMLTFTVTNTLLAVKKQFIKPMKLAFDEGKAKTAMALDAAGKDGKQAIIEFHADFRTLPPLVLPLPILQSMLFEKLSVGARPVALFTIVAETIDALNLTVTKRNQMVQTYKISQIPPEILIRIVYGFPIPPGHLDQEYSDTMHALYVQTDDIIFFSSQLAEDLCAYAEELLAKFKRKFGRDAPRVLKPDWSKAKDW